MTKTILAIACLLIVTTAVHLVHEQLQTGVTINIKGSNGKYLSRSNGYDYGAWGKSKYQYPAAIMQAKNWRPWSKWVVEKYGDKYAFKSVQVGNYLGRCNKCWKVLNKPNYDNSAFVQAQNPSGASSLWTVAQLSNGKYTIKGDNDKYLSAVFMVAVGKITHSLRLKIQRTHHQLVMLNGKSQQHHNHDDLIQHKYKKYQITQPQNQQQY